MQAGNEFINSSCLNYKNCFILAFGAAANYDRTGQAVYKICHSGYGPLSK